MILAVGFNPRYAEIPDVVSHTTTGISRRVGDVRFLSYVYPALKGHG
jgi:hypothetical protein